ncbi:pulmonary surfactant-associated protein D-like [Sycon ciliatum]|uniref:pulmonary surfactant-associated protein D-like n=1 Tax=Sycon ciliatum TaxID=27933 RepID=UPI0031F65D82
MSRISVALILCALSLLVASSPHHSSSNRHHSSHSSSNLRHAERFLDSYEDGLDMNGENEDDEDSYEPSYEHSSKNESSMAAGTRSATDPPTSAECCGDSEHGLVIFRYTTTSLSHHDARKSCQRNGGDLAAPRNMQEFIVLENLLRASVGTLGYWIGYNDIKEEGRFVDNDGNLAVINNFLPDEPNNDHGGEDCVDMQATSGLFNDLKCSDILWYACEFRIP